MPYAPGIQDISGQLIAQGMSQAGAAKAAALRGLGESIAVGIRTYQQNQLMTNQALGRFGSAIQSDPSFKQYVDSIVQNQPNAPQVPPALKKAFENAAAGKVDIYDAALLGTAAEGFQQSRQAQMQQMLQFAQARKLSSEARQMEMEQDFMRRMLTTEGAPAGAVAGGGAEVPAGVAAMAAPQGVQMGAPAPAAPAPAGQMAQPAPSAIPQAAPGTISAIPTEMDMRTAFQQLARSTGQLPLRGSVMQLATQMAKERAAASKIGDQFDTLEDATRSAISARAQGALPPGLTIVSKFNEKTNKYYNQTEVNSYVSQEDKMREKEGILALERLNTQMLSDKAAGAADMNILGNVRSVISDIESGKLKTGITANLQRLGMQIGAAAGLPVDKEALASMETAVSYFGSTIAPYMAATKGAISDREMEIFRSWGPDLAKSEKANLELLRIIERRAMVNQKLARLADEYDNNMMSQKEYRSQRMKVISDFNDSIPTVEEIRSRAGVGSQKVSEVITPQSAAAATTFSGIVSNLIGAGNQQGISPAEAYRQRVLNDARNQRSGSPKK